MLWLKKRIKMKEAKEKIKKYSCFSPSHHYRPNDIPQWQMEQFENDDAEYVATRQHYIIESIKDEKRQSLTKSIVEVEKTKQEFATLAKTWKKATAHFSLVRQQITHISFLRIIALGEKVIPFILEELKREPMQGWFTALQAISNEDNIDLKASSYKEAIECWVNWGKDKGYLKS